MTLRTLQGRGEMLFDAEGNPIRMFGTSQDVTARRHTEDELRQARSAFQGDFVVMLDGELSPDDKDRATVIAHEMIQDLWVQRADCVSRAPSP